MTEEDKIAVKQVHDTIDKIIDSGKDIGWTYTSFLNGIDLPIYDLITFPTGDIMREKDMSICGLKTTKLIDKSIKDIDRLGSEKQCIDCKKEIIEKFNSLAKNKVVLKDYELKAIKEHTRVFKKIYDREMELLANGVKYSD